MKNNRNHGRAYVYARVKGGDGTPFNDYTLAAQRKQLMECAKAMGLDVAEQDAEIAYRGITEEAKNRLLDAAASGKIGTLLIAGCGRLYRESEKALDLLEELDRYGVSVYSLQEGWINVPDKEGQPTILQLLQTIRSIERKAGDVNAIPG